MTANRAAWGLRALGINKRLGGTEALRGADLEVRPGELLALLGPSGSGKTTLLRVLAGLERPEAGRVLFGADDVTELAPARRGVGFVFQTYALFQHMTVARNVAFGLEVRRGPDRPGRAAREARVDDLLKRVGLEGYGPRSAASLSGGQKQRVALARALAIDPKILLLDEPFGALDAVVRKSLRRELRKIHDDAGVTTVFVTHDQDEAIDLADRIAVLNAGRVEQIGAPDDLLQRPLTPFVAGFMGAANRVQGHVRNGVFVREGVSLPAPGVPDGAATAFIRPDEIALAHGETDVLQARVLRWSPRGRVLLIEAVLSDGGVIESLAPNTAVEASLPGDMVSLAVQSARIFASAKEPDA